MLTTTTLLRVTVESGNAVSVAPVTLVYGWLDYVTAAATALAVVVALGLAGSERRRERKRAESEQASAVFGWVDPDANPGEQGTRVNGSGKPVFGIEVVSMRVPGFWQGDMLQPHQSLTFDVPDAQEAVALCLDFTDASGIRWRRHSEGRLDRLGRRRMGKATCSRCESNLSHPVDEREAPAPPGG